MINEPKSQFSVEWLRRKQKEEMKRERKERKRTR